MREYYTYILANKNRRLYVGVTGNLEQRIYQHKYKLVEGFAKKYGMTSLVWYERFHDVNEAIEAEKRIKGWRREKKLALIKEVNPDWLDLATDWGIEYQP
ncbi:GIY-YIG nuclease family protein [Adhaeretor mobilis]|uniref:GIY-YIG nuclease superfamily protein n=1 Tax=Adhaeretor mobilis TaxID=1930276 RepID=A0A517N1X7_9BACT|nr:GIY-YIG nuclease family protein [Adhaeretor mobilis]QDT01133.1 GIY-YIG nuclease superfamily protein [Adhaeretor mobilis]